MGGRRVFLHSEEVYVAHTEIGSGSESAGSGSESADSASSSSSSRVRRGEPWRQGWGVQLKGAEMYEGLWRANRQHGLGCLTTRGVRYCGRFESGLKHGPALSISEGQLQAQIWQQGRLLEQRPALEDAERSRLRMLEFWSVQDAARLLQQTGLELSTVERLKANCVDGVALATLSSEAAKDFVRSLGSRRQRRFLVLVASVLVGCRNRARDKVSVEEVRTQFNGLEVSDLTFDKEPVGEGGFARVYRARWMHADVAAKVFRATDGQNSTWVSRDFLAELNALCQLRHPNITSLIGFAISPERMIVTEFVECGSLFDALHATAGKVPRLDWNNSKVICTGRDICLGMFYLHGKGIVHCDLKSGNVLLGMSGEAKICDFGLAHVLELSSGLWVSKEASVSLGRLGTRHWMAPEVLRGEAYSKAADVYSFGMILWEMISRQIPFHGYTAIQVVGIVGFGRQRPALPSGCPEPLRLVLRKALRRKPSSRRTFSELSSDLGSLHRSAVIDVEEHLWTFFAG